MRERNEAMARPHARVSKIALYGAMLAACGQPEPPGTGTSATDATASTTRGASSSTSTASGAGTDAPTDTRTDTSGGATTDEPGTETDRPDVARLGPSRYFPIADGATWTYLHTRPDGTKWNEEVKMVAFDDEGVRGFRLGDSDDPSGNRGEAVLHVAGTVIYRVRQDNYDATGLVSKVTYDPGFVRFDAKWDTAKAGFTETRTYLRSETFVAIGGPPTVQMQQHVYRIEATDETVKVPAGTFSGCIKLRRERIGANGEVKDLWYAPGVGKVREEVAATKALEELVAYQLPEGGP